MQWHGEAIVIAKLKYSETSLIVSFLSSERGVFKAFVKGAISKKKANLYELGNLLSVSLHYKNEDKLGYASSELISAYYAKFFQSKTKLLALKTAIEMLNLVIPQGEENEELFHLVKIFLSKISSSDFSLYDYLEFELNLLKNIGLSLNFSKCVATGNTENLYYLSPRSGQAVSYEAGLKYHDKLLKLPKYLLSREVKSYSKQDLLNGMEITSHFFSRFFLQDINKNFPLVREMLLREELPELTLRSA